MSTRYTHTDASGDTLQITATSEHGVLVQSDPYVSIPDAEAPTFAAELLRAAGRSDLAELIESVDCSIDVTGASA